MATATRRTAARWQTRLESDFHLGIIRDSPRVGIPAGGLYDCLNGFVHRPGVIFKRGGIQYAGPKMLGFSATAGYALAYAPFPSGPQLVALGNDSHCYVVTSGATTGINNSGETTHPIDKPTFFSGGAESILVHMDKSGTVVPSFYDGLAVHSQLFAGGPTLKNTGAPSAGDYTLTTVGTPTGGTFKITVAVSANDTTGFDSPLSFTTATIPYNESAANIKTAIDTAIASTGQTVSASGGALPTAVVITFPAGFTPSVTTNSLTGGSSSYPYITNTTSGSSTVDAVSVPTARFSESHLQRLVFANSAAYPTRVWFSPVLNVTRTGWDLANNWLDVDAPVTGLASLSGQLIIFTQDAYYRLTGAIPPGEPDTDMVLQQMSEVGCADARSITISEGKVIWANPSGVYMSAGVAPVSLMEGRIESYWQSLFSGYIDPLSSGTTWTITTGVYGRRFLFVTVLNGTSLVATLVCDLTSRAWVRCDTIDALMYATSVGVNEDLYFVNQGNNRVCKLSGLFSPSGTIKNDVGMGSGETSTAVTMTVETRPLAAGVGLKAFGDAEVLYDMRDASTDNPTLAVKIAPGVEATTFATVAESPLAEVSDLTRKRVAVSKDSECVSFQLTQSNASSKTEIYGIEWTERQYSPQAEGQ